jgi:hypothetical protein
MGLDELGVRLRVLVAEMRHLVCFPQVLSEFRLEYCLLAVLVSNLRYGLIGE